MQTGTSERGSEYIYTLGREYDNLHIRARRDWAEVGIALSESLRACQYGVGIIGERFLARRQVRSAKKGQGQVQVQVRGR